MDTAAALSHPSADKYLTYKNINEWGAITFGIFLVLGILNTFKTLRHGFHFDFSGAFWPVFSIIYLLVLIDYLVARTAFILNQRQLTVIKRRFLYKNAKTYELDKMEEIEVKRVTINTIFSKKKSDEYILTFFYNDKEIALGAQLNKFDAQGLYENIIAAMHQD